MLAREDEIDKNGGIVVTKDGIVLSKEEAVQILIRFSTLMKNYFYSITHAQKDEKELNSFGVSLYKAVAIDVALLDAELIINLMEGCSDNIPKDVADQLSYVKKYKHPDAQKIEEKRLAHSEFAVRFARIMSGSIRDDDKKCFGFKS